MKYNSEAGSMLYIKKNQFSDFPATCWWTRVSIPGTARTGTELVASLLSEHAGSALTSNELDWMWKSDLQTAKNASDNDATTGDE
jgi:hypothetical protein